MSILSRIMLESETAAELVSSATPCPTEDPASAEALTTSSAATTFETFKNTVLHWLLTTGLRVLIAIILLFVCFWLINFFSKRLKKKLDKKPKIDKTLSKTLIYVGKIVLKTVVVVTLVAFAGINVSAFTALLASAGVTVGLAINGALGNAAGGFLILITRPFRIDDFVDIAGNCGTVEEIRICHTKLRSIDNKVIYVPNGIASSSTVTNFSEKDMRRVDIDFSISYGDDSARAVQIVLEVAEQDPRILKEPAAPFAAVASYDSSAVIIRSRNWVKSSDYWNVYFDLLAKVRAALEAEGMSIPFNQLDVHIK